ncbi:hypothetical protein [Pseudomonas sp. H3(2019)]|uniref:hypothetical protein n=1 Tax=Pseudomonas sp. H3(2019) TaxID=2598724 RepID=UPI0015B5DDE1|nr:hypothetical protein [Pseudomonas sp. H3(2019)]
MSITLKLSPLFIAVAAHVQAADDSSHEGFVKGSSLKLNADEYRVIADYPLNVF